MRLAGDTRPGSSLCESASVTASRLMLLASPDEGAIAVSELLRGEGVMLLQRQGTWAQVSCDHDGYVGFVRDDGLGEPLAVSHRIIAPRTPIFSRPDIKSRPLGILSMGARIAASESAEDHNARYIADKAGGWIVAQHLAPLAKARRDWVASAESFAGTPYLWGGRSGEGIDCSGMVQLALSLSNISSPRDSHQQEEALGETLAGIDPLRRGDLVFWKGHVGVMRDSETLLHANAFHMMVASEPLAAAKARFERAGLDVTALRRIDRPDGPQ